MSADGLVLVDKPAGPTSHDVVSRVRRLAGTRRVGHAGTLDPMATGMLVLGLGRATRLLGHLALTDKSYQATIRLGVSTTTDDAEGTVVEIRDAHGLSDEDIDAAVARDRGEIEQVPSSVSAIKVNGQRAYKLVRSGEQVALAARRVTVTRFDVRAIRRDTGDDATSTAGAVDVDVVVDCSTGTYVRALARDLGDRLGVGGHLTALRRTRVGPYRVEAARTLEQLGDELVVLPLADAAAAAFPRRDVDAEGARDVGFGRPLPALGAGPTPVAVFGPDGSFLALVAEAPDGLARPVAVFTG